MIQIVVQRQHLVRNKHKLHPSEIVPQSVIVQKQRQSLVRRRFPLLLVGKQRLSTLQFIQRQYV